MIFQYVFPIQSNYRDVLLGLEWVIIYFCFEFFILFLVDYIHKKQRFNSLSKNLSLNDSAFSKFQVYMYTSRIRDLAWGFLFLCIGVMYIMYIISDFYVFDMNLRSIFRYIGYFLFILGVIGLAYSLEQNELKMTHFFYTKVFIGFLVALFLFIGLLNNYVVLVVLAIWPFIFILLVQFIRVMILRAKGLQKLIRPIFTLFIGMIFLIFGFALSTDFFMSLFGDISRLIGDIVQLGAIIICAISFYVLPSFSEYDWLGKIRAIFIIHPSGISLFSHDFRPIGGEKMESDLTSGAIIAIKSMLEEMSLTGKRLESIKKAGFTILMEYGRIVLSVMFVDEDSVSLREKNHEFCEKFENMFPSLKNFYGNVDQFRKAEKLINKIFVNTT